MMMMNMTTTMMMIDGDCDGDGGMVWPMWRRRGGDGGSTGEV